MGNALDHPWRVLVCSLSGSVLGEAVNARDRSMTKDTAQITTFTFTIRLDDELAPSVAGDALVKVYRGTRLMFVGPITTAEEVAESGSQTIKVVASDGRWRLTKRLIPASLTDIGWSTAGGYTASSTGGPNAIFEPVLDSVNMQYFSGVEYTL